jgi:hypothetical protein
MWSSTTFNTVRREVQQASDGQTAIHTDNQAEDLVDLEE